MSGCYVTAKPNSQIITVTPDIAKSLLKHNKGNRPVRAGWVNALVGIIKRGEWLLNNDAITIDKNGNMINGQHRLLAIIETGISVKMVLLTGAEPEAYGTMDSGSKRTMAERTHLPKKLTSDAALLFAILTKFMTRTVPSPEQITDICDWWRPAHDAVAAAGAGVMQPGMDNSSVRLGFGLRWALEANPADRHHLLEQYRFLLSNETGKLDTSIATLWQRLSKSNSGVSRNERGATAAAVLYYTDPKKRGVSPIVRSPEETLAFLIETVKGMEMAFANSPKDGHPYLWDARPKVEKKLFGAVKTRTEAARAREGVV